MHFVKLIVSSILLSLLIGWSQGLAAQAEEELEKFLIQTKTLSARFVQQMLDEQGQVTQQNLGRFYLKRPGKFRWVYETPYRQEVVGNGAKVWFYDPDLEQVTIKTVDAALGSAPALLLSGEIDLKQRFVVAKQGKQGQQSVVELKPKNEDDVFRSVKVELKDGRLFAIELVDNFGQLTRIRFEQVELDLPLEESLFQFQPPEGVDVFEG